MKIDPLIAGIITNYPSPDHGIYENHSEITHTIDVDRNYNVLTGCLLIAGGLTSLDEIQDYSEKLDSIHIDFRNQLKYGGSNKTRICRELCKYLWKTKPRRAANNSINGKVHIFQDYNIASLIDKQLSDDMFEVVGECLGLTVLFSLIGVKENLNLSILQYEKTVPLDGAAMHIKSRFNGGFLNKIDIENRKSDGFGYKDLSGSVYTEHPLSFLIGGVYHNRAFYETQKINDPEYDLYIKDIMKNGLNGLTLDDLINGFKFEDIMNSYQNCIIFHDNAVLFNPNSFVYRFSRIMTKMNALDPSIHDDIDEIHPRVKKYLSEIND